MNTKKIITDAAFSLFREFPFDAITVQMILNKAEVSRKTSILMIIEAQIAVFKELVNGTTSISREEFADLLCSIMPASYKDRIE